MHLSLSLKELTFLQNLLSNPGIGYKWDDIETVASIKAEMTSAIDLEKKALGDLLKPTA